ncbi:MAG: LytTR family DNA-binding domain-containing protein [Oscillospiraceae bacterium]|nr:LytTR family DNA-binding domain-containing protein [Oscillospiraceae bacterium]
MHLIIVEDLATDREKLAEMIRQDCAEHKESVDFSFYTTGEDFLAHYQPKSCDGLFLDILLGGVNGVEAARQVRAAEPSLPIIFTTRERAYALDGFDVHATDYLIKPVIKAKVSWCTGQLREYLAEPSSIALLETSGRGHSAPVDVPLEHILYAQCFDHNVDVQTFSGVCRIRQPFRDFIAQLPHTGRFKVCGRGLVVNLSQVSQVEKNTLLLENGERFTFSRRREAEVKKAFADWEFARTRKGGWG